MANVVNVFHRSLLNELYVNRLMLFDRHLTRILPEIFQHIPFLINKKHFDGENARLNLTN